MPNILVFLMLVFCAVYFFLTIFNISLETPACHVYNV